MWVQQHWRAAANVWLYSPAMQTSVRGLFVVLLSCLPFTALAQDAQELMRQSDVRHRVPTEREKATMVLQPEKGEQRSLKFETVYSRDNSAGDRMKLRFSAPADINGTALINVGRKKEGDDEQWLYLPSFKKTRRLGNAELGDRFVNSDVFYEDLKQRKVDDFKYTLLRSEKLKDQECYVLEGVPANPAVAKDTPYGKVQVWLRKDVLVMVKQRFFDKNLKPWKEAEYGNLKAVTKEAWRPWLISLVDVQRKHRTVMTVEDRQVGFPLAADAFSQHKLAE
jgi:hypothetical protein